MIKYDSLGSLTPSDDYLWSSKVISGHLRSLQVKAGMREFTSSAWLIRLWGHFNLRIKGGLLAIFAPFQRTHGDFVVRFKTVDVPSAGGPFADIGCPTCV